MMNIEPSRSENDVSGGVPIIGRTVLLFAGGLLLLFLGSVAAGFTSGIIERGAMRPRDAAILAGIALLIGGIAYGLWRGWRTMALREAAPTGPGEERTRQRIRKEMIFLAVAVFLGGTIGGVTGAFDEGDGGFFLSEMANLRLPPLLALAIAAGFLAAFLALPLYGFRMIDDYKRERNLVAFTGGCLSVLAGYPMWAALHAGGFVPAPHAFGIFAIAYVSMILAFLYARWRL